MAKRLLFNKTVSDDFEKSMISKLKVKRRRERKKHRKRNSERKKQREREM